MEIQMSVGGIEIQINELLESEEKQTDCDSGDESNRERDLGFQSSESSD
jgi:hypothetical protein